jgi:hypothetical protein
MDNHATVSAAAKLLRIADTRDRQRDEVLMCSKTNPESSAE